MTDIYDKNGYGGSDFKRNARQEHNNKPDNEQDGEEAKDMKFKSMEEGNPMSEKVGEYMKELLSEKLNIDQTRLPIATRLLDQEVTRVQSVGRVPPKENRYVDIYREKPIKVSVKVLVPVKEHPKFNFVGKLLGPKGNSMKRLQEETMCKMAVLGRGSMKDRAKEDELRNALDPKYAHLTDELHVEISALGPPAEAHARIAYALAEVRKYLIPDANDVIRQEQIRELQEPGVLGEGARGRGRPPPPYRAPPLIARGGLRAPPPPVLSRAEVLPSQRVMPAKTKIMSILDRARVAMEETYGYDDPYETGAVVSSRHHAHAEVDDYAASGAAHYAGAYEPAPRHHHHHAPPPVEHAVAHYYRHHHDDSPAAISTAVAESYHYPRDHPEYMGSTSSSHHHHRSYKSSASRGAEAAVSRRAGSAVRESRYRASPYTRPTK